MVSGYVVGARAQHGVQAALESLAAIPGFGLGHVAIARSSTGAKSAVLVAFRSLKVCGFLMGESQACLILTDNFGPSTRTCAKYWTHAVDPVYVSLCWFCQIHMALITQRPSPLRQLLSLL